MGTVWQLLDAGSSDPRSGFKLPQSGLSKATNCPSWWVWEGKEAGFNSSFFLRAHCPPLPIFTDLCKTKGTCAKPRKQKKLRATYFIQDANGEDLNPDLGSKNKRPGFSFFSFFPRLCITKQPCLPRQGAEVRALGPQPILPLALPCSQAWRQKPIPDLGM